MAGASEPHLVVLDLMLPGFDGIEVCRQIRTFSDCYIIMLTARDDEIDKVLGLSMGADDYLVKPFSPRELMARVRAMLRRPRTLEGAPRRRESAPTSAGSPRSRGPQGLAGRRRTRSDTHRVRPAGRHVRPPAPRVHPASTHRPRLGPGLVRRRAHRGCPHRTCAQEAPATTRRSPPTSAPCVASATEWRSREAGREPGNPPVHRTTARHRGRRSSRWS